MKWGHYTDLHPDDIAAIRATSPVVYLPWGALEWHGPHLPMGVDGLIAQEVASHAAHQTGGVILPTTWWPITPLPHPETIATSSTTIACLWDDIFTSLANSRWSVVVVISGHYSPGHQLVLMNAAEKAIQTHGLLVLAIPPMALIDETMLDHAGLWETSLMLALRPELVNLDALGNEPLKPVSTSIVGDDPRGTATASMGRQALAMAIGRIASAVEHLLQHNDVASLYTLYEQRRLNLTFFTERYDQGSLEVANKAWWQDIFLGK
jgi:creatinine amidohydrolase